MIPTQTGCSCSCSGASKGMRAIFSCSGAADVGELADRVARKLTEKGKGKMFCLAGIGGKVSGIVKSTEAANFILAIDGCPLDCAKKTLAEAGFKRVVQLRLTDLGFEKGQTRVNETNINKVIDRAEIYL